MAHRISAGGSFRIDRRYPKPIGRLALASGATTRAAFNNVLACCDRLVERGRVDVLLALQAHQITVAQMLDADRRDGLDELLASLTPKPEHAALWKAVETWLGPLGDSRDRNATTARYAVSWRKLQRSGLLAADAPVTALAAVDWATYKRSWPHSPTDWMHLRRAVLRFLTVQLGDKYHSVRRAVVANFPRWKELERVPDLDVATLWAIVNAAPEHVRASFVAIVALGLRAGEYLRMRTTDLHPITKTVSVPGTKTAGSAAVLDVAPEVWPWVVRAVPCPVDYDGLYRAWKDALRAAGADPTLRLHDLRHMTAQVLANAGCSEAAIQVFMRHATPSMTRRYAMQKDRGANAAVLARELKLA